MEFFDKNDSLHFLGLDLSKSHEELAEFWVKLQLERYQKYGLGHLAVVLKETRQLIGLSGIIPRIINGEDRFEIAYSIKPEFWGNGYATEAAMQMKNYGFQYASYKDFISIIDLDNEASAKVARKNGMRILFSTDYEGVAVNIFGVSRPPKLFLDDVRDVEMIYDSSLRDEFQIVRNYADFVNYIQQNGLPSLISFDNDLGLNSEGGLAPDGYAAAKWLVYESGLDLTHLQFKVHSANPVAAEQIRGLLNNYIKHLKS